MNMSLFCGENGGSVMLCSLQFDNWLLLEAVQCLSRRHRSSCKYLNIVVATLDTGQ